MNWLNTKLLCSLLAAWTAIAVWVGECTAGPFSQLVVFGDSLSDVGNIAQATFDIYPGQHYYNDRFSNGPVFVEALSAGLGLGPPIPSTAGGNNFAYGGAQTSGTGGINGLFIRDIDEQVDQFLATRSPDASSLYLVLAGSNDFVNGQSSASVPAANLAEDIGRLVTAGARKFLVPNLPLLGHTPRFNVNPITLAQYNERSTQFNAALEATLDNFEMSDPTLTIYRLDVAALFSEALANPAAFGLTNVSDAAAPGLEPGATSYDTNQIAPNPNEYLFWDDLHPTATVHAALAQRALSLVTVPGDYNQNGIVDAADYVVWRNEVGQMGGGLAADGNGNGQVDPSDYDVWRTRFGQAVGGGTNAGRLSFHDATRSSLAFPEPSSLLLFLVGAILCATRRT